MVCSKCQKLTKSTALATPGVKKKNDMYYGSPAGNTSRSGDKTKTSATLGNNGVGKVCNYAQLHSLVRIRECTDLNLRANFYPKPLEIPTQHTRAHAPLVRRKSIKDGHIAKNVPIKPMVRYRLPYNWDRTNTISSMRNMW
jgi:hypothetical protein